MLAALQDDGRCARAGRDVCELKRDVATAHERNALGQIVELEKAIARDQMLFARYVQACGLCSGCNDDVRGRENIIAYGNGRTVEEPRARVVRRNTRFAKALLAICRNRICKRSLESHELAPIDVYATANSMRRHALGPVNELRRADQDLFRVAAAQCTRASVRKAIDDRDVWLERTLHIEVPSTLHHA